MSSFWSIWVIAITVLTIIGVTWVLFANRTINKDDELNTKTTGHVYDGIEEYDNPLPAWWFNMFLASVIFGVIYLILYPGLGNFKGVLGWTQLGQWEQSVEKAEKEFIVKSKAYTKLPADQLVNHREAIKMGKRIFKSNCTTCHGGDAKGNYAFPDLTDNEWLYGGSADQITQSITNGRQGAMPAWGGVLGADLDAMAEFVSIMSTEKAESHPMKEKYTMLCSACHSSDGTGNLMFGAPSLVDNIWLYGGSVSEIKLSIDKGRNGNMPAHKDILTKERIHLVTGYVMSLSSEN